MISPFYSLPQNDMNIICVSSSPRSEKVKKILWERFVQKEYHLCNTNEWMRKLQTKIRHRSSTWKQQEVQLLRWMNFRWKTFKIVASMKRWSTRETCVFIAAFHRYITYSILVNGWRATCSGWRSTRKKTREKQSEVQGFIPRSSGTSRDAINYYLPSIGIYYILPMLTW